MLRFSGGDEKSAVTGVVADILNKQEGREEEQ